jgi:hypothetical protein
MYDHDHVRCCSICGWNAAIEHIIEYEVDSHINDKLISFDLKRSLKELYVVEE